VLELGQKQTSPHSAVGRYLFTHLLVCGDCGAFRRGQPDHGHKGHIRAKYREYGEQACACNTVSEARLKEAIFGTRKDDILSPARLDAIEADMVRQLEEEQAPG
jgi:hypothetical protein